MPPSELVFVHGSRFADAQPHRGCPVPNSDVPVDPDGLLHALVTAALVANHEAGVFTLQRTEETALFGLLSTHAVGISPGPAEPCWPADSLEGRLAEVVGGHSGSTRIPFGEVSRLLLSLRRLLDGLRDRTAFHQVVGTRDEAVRVLVMVSDFRAADPRLAQSLRRSIAAALRDKASLGTIVPAPVGRRRPPRKKRDTVDLADWTRLNRNPANATKPGGNDSRGSSAPRLRVLRCARLAALRVEKAGATVSVAKGRSVIFRGRWSSGSVSFRTSSPWGASPHGRCVSGPESSARGRCDSR